MYHLNIKKEPTNIIEKVVTNVKPNVVTDKLSLIGLNVGRIKRLYYVFVGNRNKFIIRPNELINLFDSILEFTIKDEDEIDITLTEDSERLSKLFDNHVAENNTSIINPIDGLLKHGINGNGNRSFVIDPINNNKRPIVYTNLDVKLLVEDNKVMKRGQIILHGDHDLSNYAEIYGFNNFFNYFISIVQEIYGNQGINVNSKHIEMVLRQMTNVVSISDPGNSPLVVGCCYR